ncbi:MAG: Gfo/Idh/MocA family oxidoreductase [Bryobacteraceae bacterium]
MFLILISASLTWPTAEGQKIKPKLRVVHIGFELDGSWKFSKDASVSPDAELVGVADPHEDLLARARKAFPTGVRFYADYVRMLDEVKPDAVLSTTANSEHLAVLRECARRGLPVWFQKPAAASANDAREMLKVAREKGILVMISDHTQFTPAAQTIAAKIQEGWIGPVQRLQVHHRFFGVSKTLSSYYQGYFRDQGRHGGGAIMDQGTYGINWAVCLLGRPQTVYAVGHKYNEDSTYPQEDYGLVILNYENASVIVEAGWWERPDFGKGGRGELWVHGPKGTLWRDDSAVRFERAIAQPSEVSQTRGIELLKPRPEDQDGVSHFLHAVRYGGEIAMPHRLATHVVINEIVEKAYESIRTGRAVAMDARLAANESDFLEPPVRRLRDVLRGAVPAADAVFAQSIAALAKGRLDAGDARLQEFANELRSSLAGLKLDPEVASNLACDVATAVDPRGGSIRQTRGAVSDFSSQIQKGGVTTAAAARLAKLLEQLAPEQDPAKDLDSPLHPYLFPVTEAPAYDQSVLVEDGEGAGDFYARWYQAPWSSRIEAIFDSGHKFSGRSGITLANTQERDVASGTAKIAAPPLDLRGMNAIRFWFQPHAPYGQGSLTIGFLEASGELWQVDLPEVLAGGSPRIVQVRLSDFRRVLRRNNHRIDTPVLRFALWMKGSYRFTIDDIRFVHDPAVPGFF